MSVSALLTWCSELQQAEQLAALLRRFDLRSHVNVIPVRLYTSAPCCRQGLHKYARTSSGSSASYHIWERCSLC